MLSYRILPVQTAVIQGRSRKLIQRAYSCLTALCLVLAVYLHSACVHIQFTFSLSLRPSDREVGDDWDKMALLTTLYGRRSISGTLWPNWKSWVRCWNSRTRQALSVVKPSFFWWTHLLRIPSSNNFIKALSANKHFIYLWNKVCKEPTEQI